MMRVLLLLLLATYALACKDSNTYRFNNNPDKNCKWVAQKPSRCQKVDSNNESISKYCQETCDLCSKEKRKVGQYCSADSDCESWTCRENTCYASDSCKPIKQLAGQEFDENMIVLVFVGSGFRDLMDWKMAVTKTFYAFDEYEMFDYGNSRFVALYVDELEEESYCNFQCQGVPTLLCCQLKQMRALTNKCIPPGANVNTIVIENSEEYGGGGYFEANMATTSMHKLGPQVAVHELMHSLFELADEYTSSHFGSSYANCDIGCSKWSDLDKHLGGGLCSTKGCRNGEFNVPGVTFMQYLDQPVGEVNTRYTCCTYIALTGGYPSYCSRYEFGKGLLNYCKNDYQGYGKNIYEIDNPYREESEEIDGGKFVLVPFATTIYVNMTDGSFDYEEGLYSEGPRLVKKRSYYGDFPSLHMAIEAGVKEVKKLVLEFDSDEKQILYYESKEKIDMPPNTGSERQSIDFVEKDLDEIEVVIDSSNGIVIGVEIEQQKITWFTILVTYAGVWMAKKLTIIGVSIAGVIILGAVMFKVLSKRRKSKTVN